MNVVCLDCERDLIRLRSSDLVCLRCGFVCSSSEDMILHLSCESHEPSDCCPRGRVVGFEGGR